MQQDKCALCDTTENLGGSGYKDPPYVCQKCRVRFDDIAGRVIKSFLRSAIGSLEE